MLFSETNRVRSGYEYAKPHHNDNCAYKNKMYAKYSQIFSPQLESTIVFKSNVYFSLKN